MQIPNLKNQAKNDIIPWRAYTVTILGVWLAFCLATFSAGIYFSHAAGSSLFTSIMLIGLYLFVIILCIKHLISNLSIAALMLLVPIAPLAVLILVIAMLPIIQHLR